MRVRTLPPLVKRLNGGLLRNGIARPTKAEGFYHSPRYRAWRDEVKKRAGYRCEAVDAGKRCEVRAPDRLYADHIQEIEDNGDPFDLFNGQCLCHSHHQAKTAQHKRDRQRD